MIYNPDAVATLYGSMLRQALRDHCAGWQRKGTPSAYAFLRAAGLVDQRGQLVGRAKQFTPSVRTPRTPVSPAIAGRGA